MEVVGDTVVVEEAFVDVVGAVVVAIAEDIVAEGAVVAIIHIISALEAV